LVLGYDWKSLKKGDLVVDVAGGIGSTTIHLAKAYPDLRFIVQDRPAVVQDGIKVRFAST
jgi:ubiquinone/menaquinone biosynthesis C-methylase UbiE